MGMTEILISCLRIRSSRRSSGPSYWARWKFNGRDTSLTIALINTVEARQEPILSRARKQAGFWKLRYAEDIHQPEPAEDPDAARSLELYRLKLKKSRRH